MLCSSTERNSALLDLRAPHPRRGHRDEDPVGRRQQQERPDVLRLPNGVPEAHGRRTGPGAVRIEMRGHDVWNVIPGGTKLHFRRLLSAISFKKSLQNPNFMLLSLTKSHNTHIELFI